MHYGRTTGLLHRLSTYRENDFIQFMNSNPHVVVNFTLSFSLTPM